ncbi:hypothetical protein EGW08_000054 [Elysia chlorotica]|uniref:Uncharacterized protein n=1 Tax=Elysia chlorotica TaxID=188477 RepID=A0A3S1A1T1_ELYCH|nr:hypothetical protein EGW08_000054 [Elysia chlorotica]
MLRNIFVVCLSLALLVVFTAAYSIVDEKDDIEPWMNKDPWITHVDSQTGTGGDTLSAEKRQQQPAACGYRCDCSKLTVGGCDICKYLRDLCRQRYGHVVDA